MSKLIAVLRFSRILWKKKLAMGIFFISTILATHSVLAGKLDEPEIDRTPAGTQWWAAIWSPDATAGEIYSYMKNEKNCDCFTWIRFNFDGRDVVLHTWGATEDEVKSQSWLNNFAMAGLYVGPKPNNPQQIISIVGKLREKIKVEVVYIPNIAGNRKMPSRVSLPSQTQGVTSLERRETTRSDGFIGSNERRDMNYGDKIRACVQPGVSFVPLNRHDGSNPAAQYRVLLAPDGQISDVRLTKSSGLRNFDQAVESGIRRCTPFPRPSTGPYPSYIDINYNMYN